jgi:sporulation protein YlmC with PRC-barrel domain
MAVTNGHVHFGSSVVCSQGECGELERVVIAGVSSTLTHVIVRPRHKHGVDRLVPANLLESVVEPLKLACTLAEFEHLEFADEGQLFPASGGSWAYGPGQISPFPTFERDMGTIDIRGGAGVGSDSRVVGRHNVPLGEVQLFRDEALDASDGHVGTLRGLIIDVRTQRGTHLLVSEGHLLAKNEVAISLGDVTNVSGRITVSLSKSQVRALPDVASSLDVRLLVVACRP